MAKAFDRRGRKPGEPIEKMTRREANAAAEAFLSNARVTAEGIRSGWLTAGTIGWSRRTGNRFELHGDLDEAKQALDAQVEKERTR